MTAENKEAAKNLCDSFVRSAITVEEAAEAFHLLAVEMDKASLKLKPSKFSKFSKTEKPFNPIKERP